MALNTKPEDILVWASLSSGMTNSEFFGKVFAY